MKPNLFNWATSELSQDAFICWLLEWASPNNKKTNNKINNISIKLIEKLTNNVINEINEIEIRKQYKNIDIVVIINNSFAILIEDKVHTKNHDNQLTRYYDLLKNEFKKENIFLIYFKTGDQSDYKSIEKLGYNIFNRKDFLLILKEGIENGIRNEIFVDFYEHLNEIEQSVESYKYLPIDKWHWNSWIGFYKELQEKIGNGNWDYVPQKNGGFLGFWWHFKYKELKNVGFDYYLQLEHNKFCFKLAPYEKEMGYQIRDYYRSLLYPKAKEHNISIYQNGRIGKYMTVAALSYDYRKTDEKGIIDIDKTIEEIRHIEKMIDEI